MWQMARTVQPEMEPTLRLLRHPAVSGTRSTADQGLEELFNFDACADGASGLRMEGLYRVWDLRLAEMCHHCLEDENALRELSPVADKSVHHGITRKAPGLQQAHVHRKREATIQHRINPLSESASLARFSQSSCLYTK